MHSLQAIKRMNDKACMVKVEDNHNRNCSFTQDDSGNVILHSAKHRNTVYLKGSNASLFRHRQTGLSQSELNRLIETFF